jgi:hypothetical protein
MMVFSCVRRSGSLVFSFCQSILPRSLWRAELSGAYVARPVAGFYNNLHAHLAPRINVKA